jgi:DNA-binding MarR family transcriptional regulator
MSKRPSRLEQELRQSKPFRSVQQHALVSILKTADVVRRAIARQLDPWHVTPQQYNVLRILRGAGPAGLPTLEIGERLIEVTPGMTRLLDRLEAKRWVRRDRCARDRRRVLCYLTPEGEALLARLDTVVLQAEARVLGRLAKAEAAELIVLLDKVRASPEE